MTNSIEAADLPRRPELPDPDGSMTIVMLGRAVEIDTFRASTMVGYADEREAGARADERRKALEEAAAICDDEGQHIAARRIRALIDKEPTK